MTRVLELASMTSQEQQHKIENPLHLPGLHFVNGLPEITKQPSLPSPNFAPLISGTPYIITPSPLLTTSRPMPGQLTFPQPLSIHPAPNQNMGPVPKMESPTNGMNGMKTMPQFSLSTNPTVQITKKQDSQNDIFIKKKVPPKSTSPVPTNSPPSSINIVSQVNHPVYRTHVNTPLSPYANITRNNHDNNFDRLKGISKKMHSAPASPPVKLKGTRVRKQRAKDDPNSTLNYCRSCGQTKTSEWRRGPDGYKSLCNACGIHYAKVVKKEEEDLHSYKPKALSLNMLLS